MISRYGWHIIDSNRRLRYGDNRFVRVGVRMKFKYFLPGPPRLCHVGMHASPTILAAQSYRNSPYAILCRVLVEGTNHSTRSQGWTDNGHGAKFVGTHRTVLGMIPMDKVFAIGIKNTKLIIEAMNRRNRQNGNKTVVR